MVYFFIDDVEGLHLRRGNELSSIEIFQYYDLLLTHILKGAEHV